MTLEPVGPEDAADLAAVHARAFDTGWSMDEIAELLASPGGFGLAVREAARLRGLLIGRAVAGEAEVLTLAVDPAHRRRGVAQALLTAAVAVAEAAGADAMFLEVADDNDAAVALYLGAGFIRVGARRGYYKRANGPADAVVMRRDLNSRAG